MKDTSKLFPNDGEVFFDRTFSRIRQPKHPFKISQQAKNNLEQSIKLGKIALSCNSGSNLAFNSLGNGIAATMKKKPKNSLKMINYEQAT